jgi:predicted TPR repeat methyltransferase
LLQIQYSSGDLVADRRASYAAALADEHAYAEAAELMEQVLEMVPGWAAGWSLLGDYRQKAGDADGAIAAWRELLERDVSGIFGARLKLAAHGVVPDLRPAPEYIAALFDDYAPRFEQALVERLGYRTPDEIAAAVGAVMAERGVTQFGRVLDLGCGTGLMGAAIRGLAGWLEGVDLSGRMLEEARRKEIYDRLVQADLIAFLKAEPGNAELIVAADVFNYVGDLAAPLAGAREALVAGGLLAFSLETHDGDEAVRLAETLRFQHAPGRALAECTAAGFAVLQWQPTVIRQERGRDVPGLLVVVARD